ncbi:DUF721 domain-containing protein [Streptomyces sp. NPDC007369]|uniref:DUF721 domain-containing protein n=1 Tax=Streptomyces sp. NPDC007369 TaxID=3154589 RepID=UPI0033F31CCD
MGQQQSGTGHQDLAQIALLHARQDARWRRREPSAQQSRRHMSGLGPAVLHEAILELISERGWVIPSLEPLLAHWPAIVGEEIAAHLTAVAFRSGEFVVRADSKAWATQCRILAPHLITRLNQNSPDNPVRTIRVLSPQDPLRPIEHIPAPRPASPAEPCAQTAPQQRQRETPTLFYAPPELPDASCPTEQVRLRALARARASRPS